MMRNKTSSPFLDTWRTIWFYCTRKATLREKLSMIWFSNIACSSSSQRTSLFTEDDDHMFEIQSKIVFVELRLIADDNFFFHINLGHFIWYSFSKKRKELNSRREMNSLRKLLGKKSKKTIFNSWPRDFDTIASQRVLMSVLSQTFSWRTNSMWTLMHKWSSFRTRDSLKMNMLFSKKIINRSSNTNLRTLMIFFPNIVHQSWTTRTQRTYDGANIRCNSESVN